MAQRKSTLTIRSFNLNRASMYAVHSFQIADQLLRYQFSREGWPALSMMKMAMRKYTVLQVALVNDKRGVNLFGLLDEAEATGSVDKNFVISEKDRFKGLGGLLKNIRMHRSNFIAHRSANISFREIHEKFPVPHDDLGDLCMKFYTSTTALNDALGRHKSWSLQDCDQSMKHVLESAGMLELDCRKLTHSDQKPQQILPTARPINQNE